MGVSTVLLYMGVKLGQEWCGDSPASSKVRVHLPVQRSEFICPGQRSEFICPVQRSGFICPVQRSGFICPKVRLQPVAQSQVQFENRLGRIPQHQCPLVVFQVVFQCPAHLANVLCTSQQVPRGDFDNNTRPMISTTVQYFPHFRG